MVAVAGAVVDTPGHSNPMPSALLAVLAEACDLEPHHRAYVSQASSPGSANTTWACAVHRLLSEETQVY